MGCIFGIVFGILQFASLVLIAVGTPIGMYQPRNENVYKLNNDYCITMWGIRDKCYELKYSYKPGDVWSNCDGRLSRFKAAETCAIVAAILVAVSIILNAFTCCCSCCFKYISMALCLAAVVLLAISWGCMLNSYLDTQGSYYMGRVDVCVKMKSFPGVNGVYTDGMQLGTGFILLVVACAVNFVDIFILLIPC